MNRPWSYRHIKTDDLVQLGMINLHHAQARGPSESPYATKVEQVLCELAARVNELNQELDLGLPNNGRAR
jgi:hypothetical protein